MSVDKFGRHSSSQVYTEPGVSVRYVNNNFLRRDGSNNVAGNISLNNNKIISLANPTEPQDATTKSYADSNFMKRDGTNPPTGNLNMNDNKLTGLANPTGPQDATTKSYADSRKPVITIWAQKGGHLTGGQYEWSFGGGDTPHMNGYCMPVSGRILRGSLSSVNNIRPSGRASINIIINGRISDSILKDGEFSRTRVFSPPLEVSQNDRINFRTLDDVVSTNNIVSLLIELDL